MRFTESKKRKPWIFVGILVIVGVVLALGFCQFSPTPQTVQKMIVFEAD